MSKLNHLMLIFAAHGCEKGAGKLKEISEDIKYLNERVLPFIREAGITNTTIGEILNFSRIGIFVEGVLTAREIQNRKFISYSGKCVVFKDKDFLSWYIQTDEGKENKTLCDSLSQSF
ncbi:MAG: hypothetical protein IJZ63_00185 [Clostridia bacterium]|nr:hypothetical protein [Clostridia bacterium]